MVHKEIATLKYQNLKYFMKNEQVAQKTTWFNVIKVNWSLLKMVKVEFTSSILPLIFTK